MFFYHSILDAILSGLPYILECQTSDVKKKIWAGNDTDWAGRYWHATETDGWSWLAGYWFRELKLILLTNFNLMKQTRSLQNKKESNLYLLFGNKIYKFTDQEKSHKLCLMYKDFPWVKLSSSKTKTVKKRSNSTTALNSMV